MLVASLLMFSLSPQTSPPVDLAAWLDADELKVGGSYTIQVEIGLPEGTVVEGGGLPEALLQIDCPRSVKLDGPYYDTFKQRADHEHLIMPYERLFDGARSEVGFKLTALPEADTSVGLIVVGYADPEGDAPPFFFRRRLELPLVPGAEAVPGNDRDSSWGRDESILQIGDSVPNLELPLLGGEVFALDEFLGQSKFLISTYRAYW